jgi:hypothetical protein
VVSCAPKVKSDKIGKSDKSDGSDKIKKVKEEKIKQYFYDDLVGGLTTLNNIGLPIHIIYGNHDYESIAVSQMVADAIGLHGVQPIHSAQPVHSAQPSVDHSVLLPINIVTEWIIAEHNLQNLSIQSSSRHSVTINGMVINFVFVSYDDNRYDDSMQLFGQQNVESAMAQQLNDEQLYDFHIICCHYPLISYRCGKQTRFVASEAFNIMTRAISRCTKPVYYLCADTHNYQHITVEKDKKSFDQIVLGTGGANYDTIIESGRYIDAVQKDLRDVEYTLRAIALPFGFCEFTVNRETRSLGHQYIHVVGSTNPSGTEIPYHDVCFNRRIVEHVDLPHAAGQHVSAELVSAELVSADSLLTGSVELVHAQSGGYLYKYLKYKKKNKLYNH